MQVDAETVALVVIPVPFEIAAVRGDVCTMPVGFLCSELTLVDAQRIRAPACFQTVVATGSYNGAPQGVEHTQGVEHNACSFPQVIVPEPYICQGHLARDVYLVALPVGKGHNHFVTFILHIVTFKIVVKFFFQELLLLGAQSIRYPVQTIVGLGDSLQTHAGMFWLADKIACRHQCRHDYGDVCERFLHFRCKDTKNL